MHLLHKEKMQPNTLDQGHHHPVGDDTIVLPSKAYVATSGVRHDENANPNRE